MFVHYGNEGELEGRVYLDYLLLYNVVLHIYKHVLDYKDIGS